MEGGGWRVSGRERERRDDVKGLKEESWRGTCNKYTHTTAVAILTCHKTPSLMVEVHTLVCT